MRQEIRDNYSACIDHTGKLLIDLIGVPATANGESTEKLATIRMDDVPITDVIQALARLAGIKVSVDPKLFASPKNWHGNANHEPTVTFAWTNISADQALARLLDEHGLKLVKDKAADKFTVIAASPGAR